MYKNKSVTGFPFGLISSVDGTPVTTGTVTGYYTLDGAAQATLAGTPSHVGNGQWTVNITAAEMNADEVGLAFICAGAVPVYFTIPTRTEEGGAIEWTYTLTESSTGNPIAGADVWVSRDSSGTDIIARGTTDDFGNVTFYLDAGSIYVWRALAGYSFDNPDHETVTP